MRDSDTREDPPTTDTSDDRNIATDTSLPEAPTPDPDGPQETELPAIDPLPPGGGPS